MTETVAKHTFENYWADLLQQFVGCTIDSIAIDDSDFDVYAGFNIRMPDGHRKLVWVLSDEEGNGPGRFQILDYDD